jgi:hypothetical protein
VNEVQPTNPLVKKAISAMNSGDRETWFELFTPNTKSTDDGNRQDFTKWSDSEIFGKGRGRLVKLRREEDRGPTLYGTFNSAEWGTFETVLKFHIDGDKLSGLDVAQVK